MKQPKHFLVHIAFSFLAAALPLASLRAESKLIEPFKFSGGIVIALDFEDGKSIAELATDGPFIVHGLLSDEARVEAARHEIQQAGVYGKVSCDGYNGRDLPYVDGLVNLVLCKASCKVPQAELMRVLVPGGRLLVEEPGGIGRTERRVGPSSPMDASTVRRLITRA